MIQISVSWAGVIVAALTLFSFVLYHFWFAPSKRKMEWIEDLLIKRGEKIAMLEQVALDTRDTLRELKAEMRSLHDCVDKGFKDAEDRSRVDGERLARVETALNGKKN